MQNWEMREGKEGRGPFSNRLAMTMHLVSLFPAFPLALAVAHAHQTRHAKLVRITVILFEYDAVTKPIHQKPLFLVGYS